MLLGSAVCLTMVRCLYPSESAAVSGDGTPVVLLGMLSFCVLCLVGPAYRIEFKPLYLCDWLMLGWTSAMAAGALYGGGLGVTRLGLNMCWEWLGMGLGYLAFRLLLRTDVEKRALVLVLFAVATAQSTLAVHQVFVEKPRTLSFFEKNPDQALFEAGVYAPQGSPLRYLFEQRLRSPEPEGTFALTNNLAGFLLPPFVMAFGLLVQHIVRPSPQPTAGPNALSWIHFLAWLREPGLLAVLFGLILLLTRSRGGYLAGLVGCSGVLLGYTTKNFTAAAVRKAVWGALGGAVCLAMIGAIAGVFDRDFFGNAFKSLTFRSDYWRSSLAMFIDHPVLGCGSGLFQRTYPLYKLPWASETVADPHNLLVEIAATAGLLGLIPFLWMCISMAVRVRGEAFGKNRAAEEDGGEVSAPNLSSRTLSKQREWQRLHEPFCRHVFLGGTASFLLAWFISPLVSVQFDGYHYVAGLLLSVAVFYQFAPWVEHGSIRPELVAWGLAAIIVHMSVSSGISVPSVIGPVWMLAAIFLSGDPEKRAPPIDQIHSPGLPLLAILSFALPIACYVTGFLPNIACQSNIKRTHLALYDGKASEAEALLRHAVDADPWSSDAALLMADVSFQAWKRAPGQESLQRFQQDQNLALRRAGPLSSAYLQSGMRYFVVYRTLNNPAFLQKTLDMFGQAQRLYPNDAQTCSELAWALHVAGKRGEAKKLAIQAVKINQSHEHIERKLERSRLCDPALPSNHVAWDVISELARQ